MVGFFSGELSPEEQFRFLEKRVEILRKAEECLWNSTMSALSQIHTIILALEKKGIVEASELEEMRNKTLETIRRVEKAKDNGG